MPSPHPVCYSVGYALSHDGSQVLMLQKNKPDFLVGLWGGIGGHIEPGETAHEAMDREAHEEANLLGVNWELIEVMDRPETPGSAPDSAKMYLFGARINLDQAQAMTDEAIEVFTWDQVDQLYLVPTTALFLERLREYAGHPRPTMRKPKLGG